MHENGTLTLNGLKIQVPVRKKNSIVVTTDNMKLSNVEKITFKILFFRKVLNFEVLLMYLLCPQIQHFEFTFNYIYALQKNNSSKCTLFGIG